MDSRRSQVRWVLLGLAVLVMLLLVSCSAPPPARKSTESSTPSASAPPASEPDRSAEQARHATKAAEKRKAAVTTTEVGPGTPGVTATPAAPGTHHRKRLAGYPGEVAHTANATKIALTFDAGSSPAPTPSILKTLRAAGLHVTFFVTGKWAEQNPDLVKEIAAEGHEIGNHSYSHKDFRKLSDDEILGQLRQTDDLLTRLTGKSTKPLFRPPYGGRDKRVLSIVGQEGYTSIYWSLDSLDAFKKGITSEEIENRILDKIQGGDIVLMHCGSAPTATALPDMIDKLVKQGYQIVKVSELISGG